MSEDRWLWLFAFTSPHLPPSAPHMFSVTVSHTHTRTLLMFCVHTCSFLRSPFLILLLSLSDSAWHHPPPSLSVCMWVSVYLAGVMTYITSVGSYQGRQSHGCDTSLCVPSSLFVVMHEYTHTHTHTSTTRSCSSTGQREGIQKSVFMSSRAHTHL